MISYRKFFYYPLVLGCFVLFSNVYAQTAPLQYYIQSYQFESESYDGNGTIEANPIEITLGIIDLQNVPWIQLHFSEVCLGHESYITLHSLYDGKWQKLDAVSIEQWNNYSAFFNGGAVEIKLFLSQKDVQVFIKIDEIIVGEWYNGSQSESICGTTDERTASTQPATARLLSIGCTAWIIPNGKFATAGHCLDGSGATVVEFNVPLSLPNGTLQHPGPEDQYSVNVSTKIFTNGGIGDDWGVFEVYRNSITGLMPKQAQNAYWPLVQDYGPDSIRITGYGVDGPPPDFGNITRDKTNQTQQTQVGPNTGSSGTTMRYVTDTQGGNSGSPIIDALTNSVVGVHSHGGCSIASGNNNGTSTFHTAFWAAANEGNIPVELTSFTAFVNDQKVQLKWITATELNNSEFAVERKIDGNEWRKIGLVNGNGTTLESHMYSFNDDVSSLISNNEKIFYRLKQIDFDGSFEYSNTLEVALSASDKFTLVQNYPNPFNPSTKIKYSIPSVSSIPTGRERNLNVTLKVYDILGNEIATLVDEYKPAGNYEVEFSGAELTSGVYFYQLKTNNFIQTKKIILMK